MVYITGDTHGDINRFGGSVAKKLGRGDTLIICGDFGFIWSGGKDEATNLKKLSEKKYNICFIDGTHENFKLLNSAEVSEWNGGKVHHLGGNLYHLMQDMSKQKGNGRIAKVAGFGFGAISSLGENVIPGILNGEFFHRLIITPFHKGHNSRPVLLSCTSRSVTKKAFFFKFFMIVFVHKYTSVK